MSNQRAGKTYRAAANDGLGEMKLRNFFRDCADVLNEAGEADAAFYFEQVVEHINNGRSLPSDIREVGKILGV